MLKVVFVEVWLSSKEGRYCTVFVFKHVDTELQVSESSRGAEIIAGECTE